MSRDSRLTIHAAVATVLTAVALHPLFVSGDWFWATTFGVIVVAAAAQLGRYFALPAPVCSILGLAALLWYVTVVFASSEATFGFIPDLSSMSRLGELAGTGFEDIGQYTAPVPSLAGVKLVTVAGIGLMAVFVDLLAVGMRQAALAGLPLLAVFSVPVAIRLDSVGVLAFVVAAAGFVSLLLAEGRERLSRWGRPVPVRRPGRFTGTNTVAGRDGARMAAVVDARPLSAAGRRIGLLAILAALVLPVFVPDLPARAILGTGGFGGVGGTNTIAAPSPMVSLKRDLTLPQEREVLRYRTDDQTPEYLRIYTLNRFDGERWRISRVRAGPDDRVTGQQLSVPGLSAAGVEPVTTEISVDPYVQDLSFLPLPYPSVRVEINGDWRVDRDTLMIFSTSDVARGRTYRAVSLDVNVTRAQLRSAARPEPEIREQYLDVPEDVPDSVRRLANRTTGDATTPYDRALAIQEWFTSGRFTYSTAPQGSSASALTDFLLRSRTGYCEQFAASMALLARIVDIPARVAVGYTAGRPEGREWSVTTRDAHAWPELYFAGTGWVRFEPTPSGAAGQATASVPAYAEEPLPQDPSTGSGGPDSPAGGQGESGGQSSTAAPGSPIDGGLPALGGGGLAADEPTRPWALIALAVGIAAAVLLAVPMAGRWLTSWRRWATANSDGDRARAAWAEIRDDAIDLGLPWRPSDSPRAAARRVAEHLELSALPARALSRLASAEERARYAPVAPATHGLTKDVRTVRRALRRAAGRAARLRAGLFPASTIKTLKNAVQGIGGVLDWADQMGARARTRLLPRRLSRTAKGG